MQSRILQNKDKQNFANIFREKNLQQPLNPHLIDLGVGHGNSGQKLVKMQLLKDSIKAMARCKYRCSGQTLVRMQWQEASTESVARS